MGRLPVKAVLDTHILLWDVLQPEKLTSPVLAMLEHASLIVADISLWEVAMLASRRRIELDVPVEVFLDDYLMNRQVSVQPVTPYIAAETQRLPSGVNLDPADRLIVATASALGCPLLTADRNLQRHSTVEVIW